MKIKELSEIRIEKGYSLQEAAERIGIGWMALREYETNPQDAPLSIALCISRFYRTSIENINWI